MLFDSFCWRVTVVVSRWIRSNLLLSWFVSNVVLLSGNSAVAGDWPQHLGPTRNGLSAETGLIDSFPAEGPKQLWRVKGGVGMSGIAVVDAMAVTIVQDDEGQYVLALNTTNGETLWKSRIAPAYSNTMGDGPRGTPAIRDGVVYAYSGEGILAAINLKDGTALWQRDAVTQQNGKPAEYGMACSPLVMEDAVVVCVGAPQASVAAYHPKTGKPLWTAGAKDAAGYSSPTLLTLAGREQLVAFTGGSAIGLDPKSGTLQWQYPYKTAYNCNIAVPQAIDGKLFLSSGENHGSVLLDVSKAMGDDVDTFGVIWESQGNQSVLRNEWQTSVLLDGYLYGYDNVGSAGPVTHFTCINAKTGERVWQQLRFGKGNCIAANGKLWCSSMKGELILLKATPEEYVELARAEVIGETRQAPALSNGKLYLRDGEEIACFDVRKEQ